MKIARIGILCDRMTAERRQAYGQNLFQKYVGEILSHAGIQHDWLEDSGTLVDRGYDIIIAAVTDERGERSLLDFVRQGGRVISYGGLHSAAEELGYVRSQRIGEGYAEYALSRPETSESVRLRFREASPWSCHDKLVTGVVLQALGFLYTAGDTTLSAGTLLHQIPYGLGRIDRWAVNIPREVVLLQQGIEPVLEDGIPALDGTGKVNEGILKADDAIALDWHHDRASTVSGQKHFAVPHADLWRECLISHLVSVALEFGMTIPFIGYWPEGVDHMAMISFDSDQNQDAHAEATLELMDEVGVKSTWCMIEPGYSAPVYERVKAAGHELALHYNALEIQGGRWDSKELARQHQWFRDVTAIPNAISNKNHYTRFEGWGELFEWCEREGIQADQTRGPSKPGNVGFLFGTCHPYYPMSWFQDGNRLYDVLEIGFLTQDMDLVGWADSTIIEPFLDQVKRVDGVAHFLFHQVHIHRQEKVRDAMRMLVRQARRRGFQFWTCEQINEWCRARRMTVIDGVNELGEVVVHQAQPGTVVWIPVKSAEAAGTSAQIRFGHLCRKQVVSERKPSAV